jgi:predicted RNase H-like nuclease (RuvC/YqgF family)
MNLFENILGTAEGGVSIWWKIGGAIIAVLAVVGCLYGITKHYENIGYERRISEEQAQGIKDLKAAAEKTKELQHQLNEAQNELIIQKQKLATLTSTNNQLVSRLRESTAKYNLNLSYYSRQALEKRVETLTTVVSECTAEYSALAAHADTSELDLQMYEKSWPK